MTILHIYRQIKDNKKETFSFRIVNRIGSYQESKITKIGFKVYYNVQALKMFSFFENLISTLLGTNMQLIST